MTSSFREEITAVLRASRDLVQAAEADDGEAVERIIEKRRLAIETLREVTGGRIDRAAMRSLMMDATDAENALLAWRQRMVDDAKAIESGSRAIGGYAMYSGTASALDRSG